jgi:site-specific recombinase XerD
MARILAACTPRVGRCPNRWHHYTATRNRALIVTLWRAGLRIHEGLLLRPHHIDHQAQLVTVLRGKGGKRRVVGIDSGALAYIEEWEALRDGLDLPADAPLFCSVQPPNPGQPLWQAQVRRYLHEAARRAGIPKRVHPHGLRHSMAVDLVREGAPMPYVQRALGHSSLATTSIYLSGLGAGEHCEFMAARSWPGASR